MNKEKEKEAVLILKRINDKFGEISWMITDGKSIIGAFNAEIKMFNQKDWNMQTRAARLTAACKRCKTAYIIDFIFDIWSTEVKKGNLIDMSPYFAKDLAMRLFGRAGTHAIYVKAFAKEGRVTRNHDHDQLDTLCEKYQQKADMLSVEIINVINNAKIWYRNNQK